MLNFLRRLFSSEARNDKPAGPVLAGAARLAQILCELLDPDRELAPIGSGHAIYRSFYQLPGLPKIHQHDGDPAQAFGVQKDGRLVIYYTWSSDIGDGLEDPEVHGDPPPVREAAARMAVNFLMYALTRP